MPKLAKPSGPGSAVIDLTAADDDEVVAPPPSSANANAAADGSVAAAAITPDGKPPAKRPRLSRRLEAQREQEEVEKEKSSRKPKAKSAKVSSEEEEEDAKLESEDAPPAYEGKHQDGYFEVDQILDRRTRKYGSEGGRVLRQVVEYQVSWKIPADYTGDPSYYDPSWLVAENLDQHSLAEAFKKYPVEGDPTRKEEEKAADAKTKRGKTEEVEEAGVEFSDDSDDEEDEEEEEEADKSSDDLQELDDEEDDKAGDNEKDPDVSHLEDSDYDSPGTVELVLNRRTYRVGQSYYSDPAQRFIYMISTIQPVPRRARCHKYMRLDRSFVCPAGCEEEYVLLAEGEVVDLSLLKVPCKNEFAKFGMRYHQEDDSQRSFAYYNETGRVLHHPTGRPSVLELFAGAGGMSLGLEKHFNVKWVVDNNHMASATLQANKTGDVRIYTEDVKSFLKRSVKGDPCYPSQGEVDHIHASPPCKGFSRANRNVVATGNDMRNNKQTLLFIKAIKHFRPQTASFENVPGLVLEEYRGYLQSVVAELLEMNYQVRVKVLVSRNHGDPQNRRRLILLAAREDCKLPDMPAPTHGPGLLPIMTSKDALQILEKHEPARSKSCGAVMIGGQAVFNHIIPGYKQRDEKDFQLIADEPSRTVMAGGRPHRHYSCERYISVREAACLQSFPVTYRFFGSHSAQMSQIGNAVPVKLSTAIARSVAVVHGCAV